MTNIHPTAIIREGAVIGADCKIGPFCIVGSNVVLGERVELVSNVVIDGKTSIGDDSIVYPFAVLGVMSQDLKWQDESAMTGLRIGKRCRIREYVTIHSGTPASDGTVIGDDCQIMVNAHVGHDCKIGNSVVMSNLVQVAGHVEVEDFAILSGDVMVLQFARTINRVGLMRHGFTNEDMHAIHSVYSAVFRETEGTVTERLNRIRREVKNNKYAMDAIDFIENRSKRGIGTSNNAE